LIELADDHGMLIEGPRSGRLDLSTATGRQQARWMAMQAASESDNTSERVKAGLAREMGKGKPMGAGRSFGFEVGGMVQRPDEVEVIRDVARKFLDEVPAATIAAELNANNMLTSRDRQWTAANLVRMLSRPRNGGHVLHRGEVIGRIKVPVYGANGKVVDMKDSEPILDNATFEQVQARIASRRRGRRPTGRFLLTGLLTCSDCDRPLNGATRKKKGERRLYRCPPQLGGCGRSIDAAYVEAMVDEYMIALLSRPDIAARINAADQALTDARAASAKRIEGLEDQLAELEAKKAMGEIIAKAYDRAKPILDRRLVAARADLDGMDAPAGPIPLDLAAEDWHEMTTEEKRAEIARFHVRITISPFRQGQRRFDPERVKIDGPLARRRRAVRRA
jgi:hypothetical protein